MQPGRWIGLLLTAIAATGAITLYFDLRAQDQAGPLHQDVELPGGIPATLYLPFSTEGDAPPVVIVGHGYSADRVTMSWFSRTLASSRYAVLALDFRGHGENANPYEGDISEDIQAALEWVESSPLIDPKRVALMGHSMGAHAVIHFASRDPRPDAVVAVGSGVIEPDGPRRPPNLLLVLAGQEPPDIRSETARLFSALAGQSAQAGGTYGDSARGDAVQLLSIEGTNHITVLWSLDLVDHTLTWLDDAFGFHGNSQPVTPDPRIRSTLLYLLCVVVLLPGLGWVAGSLAPKKNKQPARGTWIAFLRIVVALTIAVLLLMVVGPPPLLVRGFGEVVVYLFVAGVALFAMGRLRLTLIQESEDLRRGTHGLSQNARVVAAVGLSLVGAAVLFAPIGIALHRLTVSPERVLQAAVMAVLMVPFFAGFHTILRRGSTWVAGLRSSLGHLLLTAALLVAVAAGVAPGVVALVLPLLVIVFLLVEIFAGAAYARSANLMLIALAETLWVAALAAAVMPIT